MCTRIVLVALLLAPPTVAGCRPAMPQRPAAPRACEPVGGPHTVCTADGVVAVRAVDARRVLVALDARTASGAPDGAVDDLYLYTSERPHGLFATDTTFAGHVEYRRGELVVVGAGGRPRLELVVGARPSRGPATVRLEHAIGLSHYTGWRGLRLARLRALRVASECDGPSGACLEVDGFRIRFPA